MLCGKDSTRVNLRSVVQRVFVLLYPSTPVSPVTRAQWQPILAVYDFACGLAKQLEEMAPGLLHNKGILPRLPMTEGAAAHGGAGGEEANDGETTGGSGGVVIAQPERAALPTSTLVDARVDGPQRKAAATGSAARSG